MSAHVPPNPPATLPGGDPRDRRLAELEEQLRQAHVVIDGLRAEIAQLRERWAEVERTGKRQAAPFRRAEHKTDPQKPGRKPGQGTFSYRTLSPDTVPETKAAALEGCPACGGPVSDIRDVEPFVEDVPEVRPQVTRYVTQSGYCGRCRRRVRSRHPEQISTATGAAGVQVGPRAKALAVDLKHRLGVPFAKACDVLAVGFGLRWTRSGACQADARLAEQARPVYEELIGWVQRSIIVHADETGWRIGTLSAWLWVFTNRQVTVYTIREGRGHAVVVEILGRKFAGILVTDCFLAYDHQALADWLKQKCLAHFLRELSAMADEKVRGAVRFARDVMAVLRAALALRDQKPTLPPDDFWTQAQALETQLDDLIDTRRRLTDPDNVRLAKRLRKQRPHVLRFLYIDGLDATNNQAERMLRPAVITRKTSGCNRTAGGADAHSTLASILVTCRQQAVSHTEFLIQVQRAVGSVMPSLLPAPQPDSS